VAVTNVAAGDMAILYLSKQGYGTVDQIRAWDTPQFLDALEYEEIEAAISRHLTWKARQHGGSN